MIKHIKSQEILTNELKELSITNLLESEEEISIAKIKLKTTQNFGINSKSNIYYYILNGEGKFIFEDKEINVKKGDIVKVPKNTKYKDDGDLEVLAIAVPKFKVENHTYF